MSEGPYTTITVDEYNHMAAVMRHLRRKIQKAREHLEKDAPQEALKILRFEDKELNELS